jgi:hypothetical protein
MKRLGKISGGLIAVMLALCSLQVLAQAQSAGRNFDHAATGFPLLGVHATTACATCHVAGIFKGTPRNCDECHALGRRVVAMPKPANHIATNAPCESCHFNTYTFVGAKYNHGTAVPGQCTTCHNGRIATGRPRSHNAGVMLTGSCDNCHRSYAFLPASWNHIGIPMGAHTCNQAGCHQSGNPANRYTAATAVSALWRHSSFADTNSQSCDVCHTSFAVWTATMHEPMTGTCSSCHNGASAQGQPPGHVSTTAECNQCHTSTSTWRGALGGMPANHVINTAPSCSTCHIGTNQVLTGPALHVWLSPSCNSCHYKGMPVYTSINPIRQSSHAGNQNCSQSSCHAPAGREGTAYVNWGG